MTDFRISGASASARTESDIRLNYGDPSKVIAAANDFNSQAQAIFYSTDGGGSWGQTTLPLAAGDVGQSDPAVDWTSDGTAWALCIGFDTGQINLRVRCYKSTDNGQTWTLDSTISGTQTAADREIIWVDHSPTSPYKDQIYATWHNGTPVFFARRAAGAGGAWQAPIPLSGSETTVMGIGGDIKTNSLGDVFVFWPDADGSRNILVAKSTDGGATFGAPVTIATTFATTRRLSIPADSGRRARVYVSAGAYRTAAKDLVYAVWCDLTGAAGCNTGGGPGTSVASTCKTRVWFARSTDGGANWSAPVMLNNQAGLNDQFHPRLAVDETSGEMKIIYYDTVDDPGRVKTDVWMQASTDDGANWSTPTKITSAQTDETASSANANQYGDYLGLTGHAGSFFGCWTDRRGGSLEEIWGAPLFGPFPLRAPIAALSRTPDYMDIFAVNQSGDMVSAWWNGNPWRPWLFQRSFATGTPIATVSRNSNQMDVFAIRGSQLWSCWFTGTWNDWFELPLPAARRFPDKCHLAALSRDPNYMDVFAIDADGNLQSIWWNGNPWRNWFTLDKFPPGASIHSFPPGAPIAALSRNSNQMDLFVAGSDNQLWSRFFTGDWNNVPTWFKPLPPSQVLRSRTPIAAISRNPNQMDLFVVSPQDGQLNSCWWNGSWHDWFRLPLPPSGPPQSRAFPVSCEVAALSRDPNYMDVFAVDQNGDVRGIWWNGTWKSWFTLGGMKFPPGAPIAANSRNSNQMDLFVVADDQTIWSTWFTGTWSGVWFPLT